MRRWRSFLEAAVALTASAMLLSSALLAAGAHEHLTPYQPDVVCTVDHGDGKAPGRAGVHGAERAHRHHCASCQLAAKSTAQRPTASALFASPAESRGFTGSSAPAPQRAHDAAAPSRGPPIS
jgi:hypothetical protein